MIRGIRRWRNCAFGCLTIVFIMSAAFGAWSFFFYRELVDFAEGGFNQISGGTNQVLEVSPDERLLIFGNSVEIRADSERDIIILATRATLYNRARGNIYFRGDHLEIADTAVIDGKLKINSKRLIIKGDVNGSIEGDPGQVENHRTRDFRKQ